MDNDDTGAVAVAVPKPPTNTGTFIDDRRNLSPDDTPADTDATLTGTLTGVFDGANASDPNGMCPGDQLDVIDGEYCRGNTRDRYDYLKQALDAGKSGVTCPYTDYDPTIACDCTFKKPYWKCGRE